MDLTIEFHDCIVNIRVAILIKGTKGYLFEKHSEEYIFLTGGRVKLGETSYEAAVREVYEELGKSVEQLDFRGVIENFYSSAQKSVQEICFVYETHEPFSGDLPAQWVEVSVENLDQFTVKPTAVIEILKDTSRSIVHFLVRQ